jgi:hypothetical protein
MVYCSSAACTVDDCCNAKDKVVLVQEISFTGVRKSEIDTPLQRSIIEEAIATTLGVPKHLVQIINITDTASRRLQHQWRRLLDASVSITYIVRVSDEEEDAIRLKMEKKPSSHIVNAIAIASDKNPSAISSSAQSTVTQYTPDETATNDGGASDEIATNGDDSVPAANSAEFPAMMVAAIGGGATFILALVGFILHRRKLRGRRRDAIMELMEQQHNRQLSQMADAAGKLQHQLVTVKRDNHKNNNGTKGGGRGKKKKNKNEIELTPIVSKDVLKDVTKAAKRNNKKKKSTHIKHRSSEGVFYYEEKKTGETSWAVPTGGDVKVVLDETLKKEKKKGRSKKGKKKGRSGSASSQKSTSIGKTG